MKFFLKDSTDDLYLVRGDVEVGVFDSVANKVENINYADLVSMKAASGLTAGSLYRITDYITTTVQANTSAATHQFDVIVTATDVDKLDENAKAIQHSGDTYFNNANLSAWELKYSLENDTTKYAWADSTNGKGVIYYMKDEWGNEAPYDFKNIMFKRKYITAAKNPYSGNSTTNWGIVNKFCAYYDLTGSTMYPSNVTANTEQWLFTFTKLSSTASTASVTDYSIAANGSGMKYCYENKIEMVTNGSGQNRKVYLNNIVIAATGTTSESYGNVFGSNCRNITLYNYSYGNTFGSLNYNMTFGDRFQYNSFGNRCYSNSFGNGCVYNSFGNNCYGNSFGDYCESNSFGNICGNNSFGNSCGNNSFGNDCRTNSFGNSCGNNSFGNDCSSNSFGNYFQNNLFGNDCRYNSFGNNCKNNQLEFGYDYTETENAMQVPDDLKYWELVSYYSDVIEDGDDYIARLTLRSPYDITLSRTVGVDNSNGDGGSTSGTVTLEANKPQTFDYTLTTSDTDGLVFTWGFSYTIDGKNIVYDSTYEW